MTGQVILEPRSQPNLRRRKGTPQHNNVGESRDSNPCFALTAAAVKLCLRNDTMCGRRDSAFNDHVRISKA